MDFFVSLLLQAQTGQADPISGGAGWVGAGLLGLVLGWMFFWHLPAKDRQVERLLEIFTNERDADRQARKVQSDHCKATLDRVCDQFKEDMHAERAACDRRNDGIAKAIEVLANRIKT